MFCDANCQFRIFHSCYYCYCHYLDWPSDVVWFFTWSFSIFTMMSSYPHVQAASAIQMPVCKLLIQRIRAAMICSYIYALNRVRMLCMRVRLLLPVNVFSWILFHTEISLRNVSVYAYECAHICAPLFESMRFFSLFFFLA